MSPDSKRSGGMGVLAHKSLMRPAGLAGAHVNQDVEALENQDHAN